MDLREALAEARAKHDKAAIDRLAGKVEASRAEVEGKLRAGFGRGGSDGSDGSDGSLDDLVPLLGELRFHRRFLDEVSAIEDAMAEAAALAPA